MAIDLRGKVTLTELMLLISLYQAPKLAVDVCKVLKLDSYGAQGPYMSRLHKKNLVVSDRDGMYVTYKLTKEGEELVEAVKDSIQRETA